MAVADLQALGRRVRDLRKRQGLSQGDLAGEGLSASYISLIESGKRSPSKEILRALASRLGCDPQVLLELIETPESDDDVELELRYAELSLRSGQAQAAYDAFAVLHEQAQARADESLAARALWGRARALENLGRLEEAAADYERLHRAKPTAAVVAPLLVVVALCRCYRELGDLTRGVELAESTLSELRDLDLAPSRESIEVISTLVGLYSERGDLYSAGNLAASAVETARTVEDRQALGAAYWNAGLVAHRTGRVADARMLVERALAIYAEGDNDRSVARLRIAHASVLLQGDQVRPRLAKSTLEEVLLSLDSIGGSAVDRAYCESGLARAALLLGESEAAVEHARRGLVQLGPGHRLQTARLLVVLAAALLQTGRTDEAREVYERAALQLEASDASRQATFAWAELAEVLASSGDTERALWAYRQGMQLLGHRSFFGVQGNGLGVSRSA
ncbi:helix-turn-helix domain-containing protein [Kitasatospora aureofaciens]|uniref:helix-turn-helix domain-containing protein n=1 Tax=Kitasatospora aureofaciens TaxID=1894 RepID=UPI0036F489EC